MSPISLTTRQFAILTFLLLFAVGFAIYGQFLNHWFLTDDLLWLKAASNPNLPNFLKGTVEFPRGPTPYWRPAIDLYFFAMYRVFHLNATAYHVTNLLVHVATACLTAAIVLRVSKSRLAAIVAAVFFVLSPAFGSAVTWASAVTELLATFLGCLAILAFLNHQEGWDDPRWLVVSIAAFTIALLAHEMAIAIVPVLLLCAVIAQQPRSRADVRRLAIALLPFVALALVYVVAQFVQVLNSPDGQEYELGFSGLHSLIDRLLWIAVPVSPYKGAWVEGAQWGVLAASIAASALSALRRKFVLPGLFLATAFAILPTAFLTIDFAPRWTYMATVPWAGFVALLLIEATGWLRARQPVVAYGALAAVLLVAGYRLVPETVDAQRWLPGQAAQMESISRELKASCYALTSGSSVIKLPLPVVDPGYAVLSLVDLLYPGAQVVRASPQMQPPRANDCLLEYANGGYLATQGSVVDLERYWIFAAAAACPHALTWQQAGLYAGELVTIAGPLGSSRPDPSGEETLLQIGRSNVVARITGPDGAIAWQIYGEAGKGAQICVTGTVRDVSGVLFIDVASPADAVLRPRS